MKKSSIIVLFVVVFKTTTSAGVSSFVNRTEFSSKNNILQPRDIFSDTIAPAVKNTFDYVWGFLSTVVNFITAAIWNTIPFQPSTSTNVNAGDIPVLDFQKTVIIEGSNGNITINQKIVYSNDEALKNGNVRIQIIEGNFYVNGNLVAKKDTEPVVPGVYSTHDFKYSGVSSFTLKLEPDGFMDYVDDKGSKEHVNYITRITSS
ncbi:uncharacterized protein LOC135847884 [Planococcus citri]|uniref:uncharacterized protein LOC135847884 n=1 Tax=Planococcus citri TaxID=170843 RepID=UPI0031FA4043